MSQASKINQSSLSEADLRNTTESPTKPGVYWFHSETASRPLMVEVRMTNGQLTVWWPNQNAPVANLKGRWRGPIPPSSGPAYFWIIRMVMFGEKSQTVWGRGSASPRVLPSEPQK